MDTQRQPLSEAIQNSMSSSLPLPGSKLPRPGSKLPMPGSRLPTPGSMLKPPTAKRKFSPETNVPEKRARLNTSTSSNSSVSSQDSLNSYPASSMNAHRPATRSSQNKPPLAKTKPAPAPSGASIRKPITTRGVVKPAAPPAVRKGPPTSSINTKPPLNGMVSRGRAASIPSAGLTKKAPVKTTVNGTAKPPASGSQGVTGGNDMKKRPKWDLKGRIQDMESMMMRTTSSNEDMRSRIQMLESVNDRLSGTITQKEQQSTEVSQELQNTEAQLRNCQHELENARRNFQNEMESTRRRLETELDATRRQLESELDATKRTMTREIEDLKFQKSTLERQRDTLQAELTACQHEIAGLKCTVAQLTSSQAGLQAELTSTKQHLEQSIKSGHEKDAEIARLQAVLRERESTIEECCAKLREHETVRRQLHNTIQELKGNIRVFCRVRPLLGEEVIAHNDVIPHMNFPDAEEQKILEIEKLSEANLNESSVSRRGTNLSGSKYEFAFDRVFQPGSSQSCVFDEISQLVQSALDGYNVCIFAYGQTGSGKTYTMEGGPNMTPEEEGMIPRAVDQIYRTAEDLKQRGWQYEFEASFLEIYNETIRDLLGCEKEDTKHEIKLAGPNSSEVMVTNLTSVKVTCPSQVHALLKKAKENRAVAETKCNERSSRSHSVFRLKLSGSNSATNESYTGNLNLVDLAGSERLKDSGSQGARLKETKAINSSLANLGNVIMALANKEKHIPYRNSKLTYLLQSSLGGNSKTLMFVNISPKEECFQESLCSLRFATKVNNCNIGTAQKKVV